MGTHGAESPELEPHVSVAWDGSQLLTGCLPRAAQIVSETRRQRSVGPGCLSVWYSAGAWSLEPGAWGIIAFSLLLWLAGWLAGRVAILAH